MPSAWTGLAPHTLTATAAFCATQRSPRRRATQPRLMAHSALRLNGPRPALCSAPATRSAERQLPGAIRARFVTAMAALTENTSSRANAAERVQSSPLLWPCRGACISLERERITLVADTCTLTRGPLRIARTDQDLGRIGYGRKRACDPLRTGSRTTKRNGLKQFPARGAALRPMVTTALSTRASRQIRNGFSEMVRMAAILLG